MKYIFKSLLLAAAVFAAASCAKDDTQNGGGTDSDSGPVIVNASSAAIGGEIILKLKSEASGIAEKSRAQGIPNSSGIDEIDRILNSVNTVRFERLFPDGGRFEERTRREGLHLWYYAKYDPSVPTSEMARMLASCKEIEIIEYSLAAETSDYRHTASPASEALSATRAISDELRNVPFPFNENERSQQMQWHYNNTGNIFAQETRLAADANVYAAWELSTGNPDVIVAVVDQGVKHDHEDLAANMWVNQAELNGTPGVDDDGNGYVDDIYGFNFTNNTGELNFSGELMHGTHVAGTIAAVNNNGIGVCGIAGGSGKGDGVKIMSCEILGKSESGSSGAGLAGQIRAIKYAADNGAVICQNSWGYPAGTIPATDWSRGSYSALSRAMEYFNKYAGLDENDNQTGPMAGGIVIFAAGNDASNENCYPAADPNVVSVGATGFTGAPAYYTNYGKWVQMSAPGGDQKLSNSYGGVYSTSVAADGSSGYEGSQGTSMACPHVSGACALAVSYYYGTEKRKGLTGEMLRQALLSSTRPIDRFCVGEYGQYLGNMGIGSLDTYKLLLTVAKMDGIPAQKVDVGATVNIDLSRYFVDINILVYTVSDPAPVKITLQGGVLKLTGIEKGRTTIVVSDGAAIRKPIEITVG
ncbi:S8 family serine peptidase [Alistipes sp. kh20]|uniref:S8 family peptidase n=1 Tax=Alistipes montrealensis TaxID=2834113 RepID=UPI001BCFBCF4|nr:S8 family serine peptidase [Alistipes montrealensis]MBS4766626.1 S8 family serine peptidase [Alistipes montrealensis]